jgi:hypothetical protein
MADQPVGGNQSSFCLSDRGHWGSMSRSWGWARATGAAPNRATYQAETLQAPPPVPAPGARPARQGHVPLLVPGWEALPARVLADRARPVPAEAAAAVPPGGVHWRECRRRAAQGAGTPPVPTPAQALGPLPARVPETAKVANPERAATLAPETAVVHAVARPACRQQVRSCQAPARSPPARSRDSVCSDAARRASASSVRCAVLPRYEAEQPGGSGRRQSPAERSRDEA